jgi:hypothetical protein
MFLHIYFVTLHYKKLKELELSCLSKLGLDWVAAKCSATIYAHAREAD